MKNAQQQATLEEGKKQQFMVGFIADYLWPQGEYRDPWNLDPPVQSRVASVELSLPLKAE